LLDDFLISRDALPGKTSMNRTQKFLTNRVSVSEQQSLIDRIEER
jgi:hypothetical protein